MGCQANFSAAFSLLIFISVQDKPISSRAWFFHLLSPGPARQKLYLFHPGYFGLMAKILPGE
ncbi:MAG TPA: hypothetical protein DCR87_02455 [Acidobacteria bacterium]|nr:hypothetical protein [Acidobacteriota bacterium]